MSQVVLRSIMSVTVNCRVKPTDEEGKTRTPEKMTELVQEAHQAHTKKALNGLKVFLQPFPACLVSTLPSP